MFGKSVEHDPRRVGGGWRNRNGDGRDVNASGLTLWTRLGIVSRCAGGRCPSCIGGWIGRSALGFAVAHSLIIHDSSTCRQSMNENSSLVVMFVANSCHRRVTVDSRVSNVGRRYGRSRSTDWVCVPTPILAARSRSEAVSTSVRKPGHSPARGWAPMSIWRRALSAPNCGANNAVVPV